MRKFLVVLAIFCSLKGVGQEDFVIRLNDTLINVALGKSYNINVKGTNLKFTVSSKVTLTYTNTFYSFLYPKAFKVSKSKIDVGIDQVSILNLEQNMKVFCLGENTNLNFKKLNDENNKRIKETENSNCKD